MVEDTIDSGMAYPSHFVEVYGSQMHYWDEGQGDPILFLHGIPTSSYLWRNIIPHLSTLGRCIAPDLIGFGKSDRPDLAYTITDHIRYIDRFIEVLNLKNIMFVLHAWGSIIGFDYAMRHESRCKGLVFYEAYLRPLNDEDLSLPYQEQKFTLAGMENTQTIINNGTDFVEQLMQQEMLTSFSEKQLAYYRAPFAKSSGKPLLQYLKELCTMQAEVNNIIEQYSKKMTESQLPKLFLYTVPGFITTIATIIWAKNHLPNLEVIDIGEATHYAQETNPNSMGESISVWLQGIEQQVMVER